MLGEWGEQKNCLYSFDLIGLLVGRVAEIWFSLFIGRGLVFGFGFRG
jgi:hypothetical protein